MNRTTTLLLAIAACAVISLSGCASTGIRLTMVAPATGPTPVYLAVQGGNVLTFDAGTSTSPEWLVPASQAGPALVQNLARGHGVGGGAPPASAEFSMTLPETKVLNASSEVVLRLYLRGTALLAVSPILVTATLTSDGAFMGQAKVSLAYSALGAPANGFVFVIMPMVSEVATLPAGSVLRLRLDVFGSLGDLAVGLGGQAQSRLNFSFVAPIAGEVYLDSYTGATIPLEEYQEPPSGSSSSSSTSSAPSAQAASSPLDPAHDADSKLGASESTAPRGGLPPGLALALLPLLALGLTMPRRPAGRLASVLVVTLLLTGAIAGCAGKAPGAQTDDAGSIREYQDIPEEERKAELEEAGTGDLVGRVFHDVGLPLNAANVDILSTDLFTKTNSKGQFEFLGLAPGRYSIRVTAPGFRAVEQEGIEVLQGNVTRLDVTMVPVGEASGSGFSSHRHDYWGANTKLTLFDAETPLISGPLDANDISPGPLAGINVCENTEGRNKDGGGTVCHIEFFPHLVNLVPAGTAALQVTISWDAADNRIDGAGFAFTPANRINPMFMAEKASGSTWNVPVSHAMTDRGHQSFSFWSFYVYVGGNGQTVPTQMQELITGPFKVKLEALKGAVVPLEPGHRDLWKGNGTIVLHERESRTHASSFTADTPREDFTATGTAWRPAPPALVPPGTGTLEILLEYGVPAGGTGYDNSGGKWGLALHPANMPAKGYDMDDLLKPKETERKAGTVLYKVPITSAMTDAYYQPKSNWMFFLDDGGNAVGPYSLEGTHYNMQFRLTVKAHIDPAYAFSIK